MIERTVNLSEKPRAVVTLQLGDRSFRISRVVNAVTMLYSAILKEAGELMGKAGEITAKEEELRAAPEARQAKLLEEIAGVSAEVEHFAAEKLDKLMRCIELLLVKNGYEFERAWWIENGDIMDFQTFIVESIMKDSPEKKTAEAAGLTGGASLSTLAAAGSG